MVRDDACAHFRTGSFAAGVALVNDVAKLARAADHHPDVGLRPDGVTVRTVTVVFCDPGATVPEWNREEGAAVGTRI